ncbi:MAG: TlpA family protein disulfide reductase [Rhodobacteraceae bacterium]|nr:TlpA family protein disulfide reductase [Paracoccaceae bacterium]
MRWFLLTVLYTALAIGANAAGAGNANPEDLREGAMKKLLFLSDPGPVPDVGLTDMDGAERRLADWHGKIVVLNFWAVWCAPCRKELPTLEALNRAAGGEDMAVVTVAVGRNPPAAITKFLEEGQVADLPVLLDPAQSLAGQMGVFGLPVSVILDREGREIARMTGEADWNSESARSIVAALVAAE